MALASVTLPAAEIVTRTSTVPDMLYLLAPGGYRGCAFLITPPHVTELNIFSPSIVGSGVSTAEAAFARGGGGAPGGGSLIEGGRTKFPAFRGRGARDRAATCPPLILMRIST